MNYYETEVWVSSDLAVALIQERSQEEQVLEVAIPASVSVFWSVCCGSHNSRIVIIAYHSDQ